MDNKEKLSSADLASAAGGIGPKKATLTKCTGHCRTADKIGKATLGLVGGDDVETRHSGATVYVCNAYDNIDWCDHTQRRTNLGKGKPTHFVQANS